ncbi:MAG TPA: DNA-3-methyladenine glycosylase [Streptosporangiaceae bacterium]|nr:DNA-3-methyladenine glycosylase [Streptosporangiaceae bacterium]
MIAGTPPAREFFDRPAEEVAPDLLGRLLERSSPEGTVVLRITEVEAYAGERDPASHAYRGRTRRNAVMFGRPGHAYVYFTYGMHFCVNLVCLGEDTAAAVLLRAGEVESGRELARARRPRSSDRDLARGPARLCQALGIGRDLNGVDVCDPAGPLRVLEGATVPPERIMVGPRTGVNGAKDVPWRFWIDGEPSVSPYRLHIPRRPPNSSP